MKKTAAVQVCTSYVSVSVFCTDCIVHSTAQVDILCDASYIKKYQKNVVRFLFQSKNRTHILPTKCLFFTLIFILI